MFDVLGFGFASAVLLVTFGKLITDSWFSYLMFAIIQFELVMFWLGLRRPLGETHQVYVDSDFEVKETSLLLIEKRKRRKITQSELELTP